MQLYSIRSPYNVFVLFGIFILTRKNVGRCNPITNSNFNEHIREFSLNEDNTNATNVRTLHKEDPKRYAELSHFGPIHFEGTPDSKLSGSSHSRGLVSQDHPGYSLHDYDEYSHNIGYGYDYQGPDHSEYDHHHIDPYHYGHHHAVGHHYPSHYKHHDHALAAKAVLWPIAGIALLGAAAALVSNPILLQLGVATGKRRRRDTEEVTGPDLEMDFRKWNSTSEDQNILRKTKYHNSNRITFQRKSLRTKKLAKQLSKYSSTPSPVDFEFDAPINNESENINFVKIKMKNF